MATNRNSLLCENCNEKAKRPGKRLCDKCAFLVRCQVMAKERMLRERFVPRQVRRSMDEIFQGGRIVAVSTKMVPRQRAPFEVSFLTKSGMRATERYSEASDAQDRFDYLKEECNAAGLRYWGVTKHKLIELGSFDGSNRL